MLAVLLRVIALLILTAYASAATIQLAPLAQAMSGDMTTGINGPLPRLAAHVARALGQARNRTPDLSRLR